MFLNLMTFIMGDYLITFNPLFLYGLFLLDGKPITEDVMIWICLVHSSCG